MGPALRLRFENYRTTILYMPSLPSADVLFRDYRGPARTLPARHHLDIPLFIMGQLDQWQALPHTWQNFWVGRAYSRYCRHSFSCPWKDALSFTASRAWRPFTCRRHTRGIQRACRRRRQGLSPPVAGGIAIARDSESHTEIVAPAAFVLPVRAHDC